ncbi:MAG: hypothetical protein WBP82_00315, partial [Leuconostoc mesenteroides]
MTNVKNYTDTEILERAMKAENFQGFPASPIEIIVRSSEDEFNKFDDKFYSYFGSLGRVPRFIMVTSGTSNAGSEGLLNFQKYNHLGCAVLKSNVWVYNSHVYG